MTIRVVLFAFAALALTTACTRLPDGFESLPPARKVAAYVAYLEDGGRPRAYARESIVNDGMSAADAIATMLGRPIDDRNKEELVMLLEEIHVRGTNLRSSRAEAALRDLARRPTTVPALHEIAEATLQIIDRPR
jgi:hypothetical protein